MDAMKEELLGEIKKLKTELTLYKNAVIIGMMGDAPVAKPRIDVPKPKEFKGARDAREVDNFVWGLEQYFRLMGIEDEHKNKHNLCLLGRCRTSVVAA